MPEKIESEVIPYKNLYFGDVDISYKCPKCGHEDKNVIAETEIYWGGAMRYTKHKCVNCGKELE